MEKINATMYKQKVQKAFLSKNKQAPEPPTALLIHGLSSSSRTWDDTTIELLKDGYNILTVDLAGHGSSPRREEYGFNKWGEDVLDIVNHYNIPTIDLLIGHSLGGLVSIKVANEVNVNKMVLVDPLANSVNPLATMFIKKKLLSKKTYSLEAMLEENPHRSHYSLLSEIDSIQKWDENTLNWFNREEGISIINKFVNKDELPKSLLIKPRNSLLINKEWEKRFREKGGNVMESDKIGHGVHHDNFDFFMNSLKTHLVAPI
jgi:pimeloyl-ACP methyl ester carboxylesterase